VQEPRTVWAPGDCGKEAAPVSRPWIAANQSFVQMYKYPSD